jgi:hypothetical protein
MDDVPIDPPQTLRGMLQRGRGAGALAAAAAPDKALEVVMDCICRDPRWDGQIEQRSVYYARLVRDSRWPLDPIAVHLFGPEDASDTCEYRTNLAIDVLGALARAGRGEATALLRRYVAEGQNWDSALDEVADLPWAEALAGLDEVVLARCSDSELAGTAVHGWGPWDGWAERHPRIRNALASGGGGCGPAQPPPIADYTALTPEDLAALVRSKQDVRGPTRELARRGEEVLLDLAEEWLPRRPGGPGGPIAGALRVFADRELLVARARSWCRPGHPCSFDGSGILAEHGDAGDVAVLTAHLGAALEEGRWRAVPGLVEGLGRLKPAGVETLLLRAWEITEYSYSRPWILDALGEVNAASAPAVAEEALWDCESEARDHAVRGVGLFSPRFRERLVELAVDPLEDDDVRQIAQARTG